MRVDLPLGELLNPNMHELLKICLLVGYTFLSGKITPHHQFCAQGIEGLVSIEPVPLNMALLAASKTGIYRIAIFVPRGFLRAFQAFKHTEQASRIGEVPRRMNDGTKRDKCPLVARSSHEQRRSKGNVVCRVSHRRPTYRQPVEHLALTDANTKASSLVSMCKRRNNPWCII